MFWPCETRTSTCRNLATISSGLYRFLAITVLLDVRDIPQVGPLQWGWIIVGRRYSISPILFRLALHRLARPGDGRLGGPVHPLPLAVPSPVERLRRGTIS